MLFSVGVVLEFISQFMTLEPGDLIATGTPPGVGPVSPGDRVRVEIPSLGVLETRLKAPNGGRQKCPNRSFERFGFASY